jgi:hypothetical protein
MVAKWHVSLGNTAVLTNVRHLPTLLHCSLPRRIYAYFATCNIASSSSIPF